MKVRTVAIQTDLDLVESTAEQQSKTAPAVKNSPSRRSSEKTMTSAQSKRYSQVAAHQARYAPLPMTTSVVPHHFSPLLASSCQMLQQIPQQHPHSTKFKESSFAFNHRKLQLSNDHKANALQPSQLRPEQQMYCKTAPTTLENTAAGGGRRDSQSNNNFE